MRMILIAAALAGIAGCSTTPGHKIEMAVKACKEHGGVSETVHILGDVSARCMDGTYFQDKGAGARK